MLKKKEKNILFILTLWTDAQTSEIDDTLNVKLIIRSKEYTLFGIDYLIISSTKVKLTIVTSLLALAFFAVLYCSETLCAGPLIGGLQCYSACPSLSKDHQIITSGTLIGKVQRPGSVCQVSYSWTLLLFIRALCLFFNTVRITAKFIPSGILYILYENDNWKIHL